MSRLTIDWDLPADLKSAVAGLARELGVVEKVKEVMDPKLLEELNGAWQELENSGWPRTKKPLFMRIREVLQANNKTVDALARSKKAVKRWTDRSLRKGNQLDDARHELRQARIDCAHAQSELRRITSEFERWFRAFLIDAGGKIVVSKAADVAAKKYRDVERLHMEDGTVVWELVVDGKGR